MSTIKELEQEKNNYLNRIKDVDSEIQKIKDAEEAAKMTAEDLKKLSYYKKELEASYPVPESFEQTEGQIIKA